MIGYMTPTTTGNTYSINLQNTASSITTQAPVRVQRIVSFHPTSSNSIEASQGSMGPGFALPSGMTYRAPPPVDGFPCRKCGEWTEEVPGGGPPSIDHFDIVDFETYMADFIYPKPRPR